MCDATTCRRDAVPRLCGKTNVYIPICRCCGLSMACGELRKAMFYLLGRVYDCFVIYTIQYNHYTYEVLRGHIDHKSDCFVCLPASPRLPQTFARGPLGLCQDYARGPSAVPTHPGGGEKGKQEFMRRAPLDVASCLLGGDKQKHGVDTRGPASHTTPPRGRDMKIRVLYGRGPSGMLSTVK